MDANDGSSDENSTASDSGETNNTPENKNSDKNGAASKLVAIICSFLDGDVSKNGASSDRRKQAPRL